MYSQTPIPLDVQEAAKRELGRVYQFLAQGEDGEFPVCEENAAGDLLLLDPYLGHSDVASIAYGVWQESSPEEKDAADKANMRSYDDLQFHPI